MSSSFRSPQDASACWWNELYVTLWRVEKSCFSSSLFLDSIFLDQDTARNYHFEVLLSSITFVWPRLDPDLIHPFPINKVYVQRIHDAHLIHIVLFISYRVYEKMICLDVSIEFLVFLEPVLKFPSRVLATFLPFAHLFEPNVDAWVRRLWSKDTESVSWAAVILQRRVEKEGCRPLKSMHRMGLQAHLSRFVPWNRSDHDTPGAEGPTTTCPRIHD